MTSVTVIMVRVMTKVKVSSDEYCYLVAGTFYEVQEYVSSGTLHRFLRDSSRHLRNAKETILDIAIGIATGMEFIANKQVSVNSWSILLKEVLHP